VGVDGGMFCVTKSRIICYMRLCGSPDGGATIGAGGGGHAPPLFSNFSVFVFSLFLLNAMSPPPTPSNLRRRPCMGLRIIYVFNCKLV